MRRKSIPESIKREPWEDGCVFHPEAVSCKAAAPDCEHCGWNPDVERRRREAVETREKGGRET